MFLYKNEKVLSQNMLSNMQNFNESRICYNQISIYIIAYICGSIIGFIIYYLLFVI